MLRVVLIAALSLFAIPTATAAGPRLGAPRLSAPTCVAGHAACASTPAPVLRPGQLSCKACAARNSSDTLQAGDASRSGPLLCSIREMPLGPTVPGCITPPLDLEAIPPL